MHRHFIEMCRWRCIGNERSISEPINKNQAYHNRAKMDDGYKIALWGPHMFQQMLELIKHE